MSEPRSPLRRRVRRSLWLLFILFVLDQIALHGLVRNGEIFGRPLMPYSTSVEENSLEQFSPRLVSDAELGWRLARNNEGGTIELDYFGSRLANGQLVSRKSPDTQRIALLGGSLALGSELEANSTFAARIGAMDPTFEILNFAVPFYGLDQLYEQVRVHVIPVDADEAWIAFEPQAALVPTVSWVQRVLPSAPSALTKLHYRRIDEAVIQIPAGSELPELWNSTSGWFGIPGLGEISFATRFGSTLALARRFERDKRLLNRESESFQVLVELVRKIDSRLLAAGIRLRVFLAPNRDDMQRVDGISPPDWTLFLDELRSYGMEVHDLSSILQTAGGTESSVLWTGNGNWSAGTHELVSSAIQLLLVENP